jgi:hypothetical protein
VSVEQRGEVSLAVVMHLPAIEEIMGSSGSS